MKILIIADHNNAKLAKATLHVVIAAKQIGGEIDILILGKDCRAVADQAAKISGITKILLCDDVAYEHNLAENIADFVANIASGYSHILTAATSTGKDFLPRAAALLDIPQVSEVIEIVSPDTFKHPIYAGNAIETVQVQAAIKILTIRHVAFDAEKNL
ncbi:MAG: electron transfer flavoprotein subunit alpha/FixB family protein, partial [Pseudomonadota bacterium]